MRQEDQIGQAARACPECGAEIVADPEYVAWCDRCGWNVQPETPPRPRSLIESVYADLGAKLGQGLYNDLVRAPTLRPTLTPSLALAVCFALVVHAITLGCALLGVFLIVFHWHNAFALLGGLLLLAIGVVLTPRPGKYPKKAVTRQQAPALYEAVESVAAALRAPRPSAVILNQEFNASYTRAGWRRRHMLRLGLPLLNILDEQETAALLAHELAHAVNGDATRTFFIGSATASLARWYYLLVPDRFSQLNRRRYGLAGMISNGIMLALAQLVGLATSALGHLVYRDSQRAEYLADHLAAEVAGTSATVTALEKTHLRGLFEDAVRRATLQTQEANLFSDLRARVAALPERERERLRRVARLEETRLDTTHPPTGYRVTLLEARPIAQPRMNLSALQWRALHQELAAAERRNAAAADRLVPRPPVLLSRQRIGAARRT